MRSGDGHGRDAAPESAGKNKGRADRDAQKRLKSVERKIAKLDDEKKAAEAELLTVTTLEAAEEVRSRLGSLAEEIEELEAEWLALSEE